MILIIIKINTVMKTKKQLTFLLELITIKKV